MANEIILIIFYIAILLYAVIIHEVMHGVCAMWLGDLTAKYAGRLNLNPINHIDPIGSILVPIFMYISFSFAFGWAKPVPYNPYNLKNQKWGPAMVALAGPLSNIVLALVAAIIAKFIFIQNSLKAEIIVNIFHPSVVAPLIAGSVGAIFFALLIIIVVINVFLAFFNLIPIPPLDGSKLLFAIVNMRVETIAVLEQFGFMILIVAILLFSAPLGAFLNFMLSLFLSIAA